MSWRKVVGNIFSSWVNLAVTVVIAFFVSPVIVKNLGKELYGVWTLIVSVTGYFTVLDFGVNTAIVRYISSSAARNDDWRSRAVFSTSMAIFGGTSLVILVFSSIFGYFFKDLFGLSTLPRSYLYAVFMVSAIDLAGGLVCSVFSGALVGLQEFKFVNGSSLLINMVKSMLLVLLLRSGCGLFTVAVMQLSASAARALCQYFLLRRKYPQITFTTGAVDRETVHLIYSYSVYSFVIAVALKLLFYTDSVVIGGVIGVSQVVFYAIPSTLLDYLEKFVWAMIAVLVPVISANEATGKDYGNRRLYVTGTRYTLLFSLPPVIALYFYGDDFIRLWMGAEFSTRSHGVLRLLLVGFAFSFSQLIAHGILKGIGRHRVLAYILALEAAANLVMSLVLARPYGIEGVAVGTMVPLLLASLAIVAYTCRTVGVGIVEYVVSSYGAAVAALAVTALLQNWWGGRAESYFQLAVYCCSTTLIFWAAACPASVERDHKEIIISRLKSFGRGGACESLD